MSKRKRIAVVGTGRMGANMARRLAECGHPITAVYDSNSDAASSLARELGIEPARTLDAVTAAADVIITVVSDDAAMRAIFSKRKNSLLTGARGRVFINCATVSPETHRKIDAAAKSVGAAAIEACMASSITQARNGKLFLMVGGNERTVAHVQHILDDLSEELIYIGPAGKAAEVKLLVNVVMNTNTAALAEGLGLGHALGIDLDLLRRIFSKTGANSRVLETDGEDMVNREHECYFSAAHAAKDSSLALALGRKARIPMPVSQAALSQYQHMISHGLGELDKSGVAELTFRNRIPRSRPKVTPVSKPAAVTKKFAVRRITGKSTTPKSISVARKRPPHNRSAATLKRTIAGSRPPKPPVKASRRTKA